MRSFGMQRASMIVKFRWINTIIIEPAKKEHLFVQLKQSKSLSEHVIEDKHLCHLIFIQFDLLAH